jgi:hypothetical protein
MLTSIEKNIEKEIIKNYKLSKELLKVQDISSLTNEERDAIK